MEKNRVFLDSSVIISALLSAKGGSFYVLDHFSTDFAFFVNQYVFDEVQLVLKEKFSEYHDSFRRLFLLFGTAQIKVLSDPSKKETDSASKYISKKDAPVLAGALISDSRFLLTLDKEFFSRKVVDFAKSKGLHPLSPKEFVLLFRK